MSHSLPRSLRILYIVSAYARHSGDVITPWLVETIHRLQEAGFEIEVLAPAYLGSASHVIEGVRVHRFRYAPRRWENLTHDETAPDRVRRYPWYLALVPGYVLAGTRAAVRLVRQGGFDIVHVHWPLPHAIQGLAAKRLAGLPTVLSFHGVELTWARQFAPFRPFLRSVIRRADALTANSEYTAGMIRSIYDRDVQIIPFGATVSQRALAAARVRERGDPFELLFVGRLVERKGVHYLLDAVAQLRKSHHLTLSIVGDGPWRARLAEQAAKLGLENVVRFEGFLNSEKLAQRFEACDAFVLPAVVDAKGDTEGLGVVLVEALAYGRPVIASAAGGIVDVVKDGETGTLVPPGDADALASAIVDYIERPERAQELAAAGSAHVQANFSWPAIIGRLADLYRALLES